MNKKQLSIAACAKQAHKYRNPKIGDGFFDVETCYMCKIHHSKDKWSCKGCPLTIRESGSYECKKFKTFNLALSTIQNANNINSSSSSSDSKIRTYTVIAKILGAFEARAKFYDWLAIKLKEYPASQFTKKGWKDFNLDINL